MTTKASAHLIFAMIPNYNKECPVLFSHSILNQNSNTIIHLLALHFQLKTPVKISEMTTKTPLLL